MYLNGTLSIEKIKDGIFCTEPSLALLKISTYYKKDAKIVNAYVSRVETLTTILKKYGQLTKN